MARYRRYRKYKRSSRGKWSPNIFEIGTTTLQATKNASFYQSFTLTSNPNQTNTTVSQTYTVKRFEVSFYIDKDDASSIEYIEDVTAYIMFVPQGMPITLNYNLEHPEYIMAYQFLGSPCLDYASNYGSVGQQFQPRKITTRLSRKLNTGDSIILFIKGNNTSTQYDTILDFHGLVRWWTKAN